MTLSFRMTLSIAGFTALAALAFMGAALGIGLARAELLLDRMSRSQTQLAMATRLEADINELLMAPAGERLGVSRRIDALLGELKESVGNESRTLAGAERRRQPEEAEAVENLQRLFRAISDKGISDRSPGSLLAEFRSRARTIVSHERSETANSLLAMRSLKRLGAVVAAVVPAILILMGGMFAWLMTSGLLRPIRALRRAALAVTSGEVSRPIKLDGYADFKDLTDAFADMAATIGTQRTTLERANKDLERQVAARTAELSQQLGRLAEIDSSRRLFFSQVSHELRTPITVVLGEAETALRARNATPEHLREALQHILANGQFAHRRLEDLLGLAGAQDGRLTLQRARFDLRDVLEATRAQAVSYARSSGLTILPDVPPERIEVYGDASWLQQALLALVDNAIKHASEGGEIRMSLVRDREMASISVADDGPGVAAHELPSLFDTYHQATANRQRGGSGLGLAVARWVAEAHKGTISAENGEQRGLVIHIMLPLA